MSNEEIEIDRFGGWVKKFKFTMIFYFNLIDWFSLSHTRSGGSLIGQLRDFLAQSKFPSLLSCTTTKTRTIRPPKKNTHRKNLLWIFTLWFFLLRRDDTRKFPPDKFSRSPLIARASHTDEKYSRKKNLILKLLVKNFAKNYFCEIFSFLRKHARLSMKVAEQLKSVRRKRAKRSSWESGERVLESERSKWACKCACELIVKNFLCVVYTRCFGVVVDQVPVEEYVFGGVLIQFGRVGGGIWCWILCSSDDKSLW